TSSSTSSPAPPPRYRSSEVVFLGNIDPVLQREVLEQVQKPRIVACDTMNFWISRKPEELRKALRRVDMLPVNDGEAPELSGERRSPPGGHRGQHPCFLLRRGLQPGPSPHPDPGRDRRALPPLQATDALRRTRSSDGASEGRPERPLARVRRLQHRVDDGEQ